MGADIKETSGPIRRFPTGFWANFNQWWHGEFARLGQRPSSKAIGRWHADNSLKVWGDQAVTYAETQRHANRMKCRRTGQQLLRQSTEDDDDDDEYALDAGGVDVAVDRGPMDRMALDRGAEEQAVHEPSGGAAVNDSPFSQGMGINFDAYSDPPGALKDYMNADSDVPAPAAPNMDLLKRAAVDKTLGQQSWMQPDPTAPLVHSRQHQGCDVGLAALSWDSAFSVIERPIEATSSLTHRDSLTSALATSNARIAKRSREEGGSQTPERDACLGGGAARPLPPHLRSNPFGDLAAAAAAAAGCSVAPSLPAARDAAALLNSINTAAGTSRFQLADQLAFPPTWLQQISTELDNMLVELGMTVYDGGKGSVLWRSRALCSQEPLRLPEPGPKRDLDSLLRRGLPREGNVSADGDSSRGGGAASTSATAGMLQREIRRRLLQGCSQVQQRGDNSSGGVGAAWLRVALQGSSSASLMGLTAIENMPLEALL